MIITSESSWRVLLHIYIKKVLRTELVPFVVIITYITGSREQIAISFGNLQAFIVYK